MSYPINVWTDGFGIAHADIELQDGDATPDATLKAMARKSIREHLGEQVGKGYRIKVAYTGMTRSITRPGVVFVGFKEA